MNHFIMGVVAAMCIALAAERGLMCGIPPGPFWSVCHVMATLPTQWMAAIISYQCPYM